MKKLFFVLSFLAFVPAVQAQMDCEEVPSCAELGYTQDSCAGGKGVRCPFDESKFYCAGVKQLPDAENPVVTDENWTAKCADKINYCTAYNTECQCTACEDTYLISDGACVPECDKSADTCAAENKTFNSANCVCEACPTNYQFNSETKACEQIACDTTKVEHCATYSSDYEPCTCQTCETNYLLVDGICKKMCTKVENCTTYDSEYDPCNCTACEDGLTLVNGVCVDPCAEKCKIAYPLFAGQENTNAAIDENGSKALAAYATHQFYVGDKNGNFGQGKWYLPSLGEWMYLYGTDVNQMQTLYGGIGATGTHKALIDAALTTLQDKGVDARILKDLFASSMGYLTSSEGPASGVVWLLGDQSGGRNYQNKNRKAFVVRSVTHVKDCFTPSAGGTAPKIGDVMYEDKTYGEASDYDGSKIPVGIIAAVSTSKRDVMVVNLRNLSFSSRDTVGNFDPENPYDNSQYESKARTLWSVVDNDIIKIPNYSAAEMLELAQASDNCPCQFYKPTCTLSAETCATQGKTFNNISCACEDCPTNYEFNSETNSCDLCTRDIPYCYSYKDNCTCSYCDSRYKVASDGTCVCAKNVEGCTSYASEAEGCKCTACQSGYELYENSYYDVLTCEKIACNLDTFAEEGDAHLAEWSYSSNKGYWSCIPGAVLYDDFQCYLPNEVPEGRIALGVVVKDSPLYDESTKTYSNTHRSIRAIAIEDGSEAILPWSENLYGTVTTCNDEQQGLKNTDCMIAAGAENTSAAAYCKAYHKTEADKDKWYLPATDELAWTFGSSSGWSGNDYCYVVWGLYRNNEPAGMSPVDYLASIFYEPDTGYGRLSSPVEYWSSEDDRKDMATNYYFGVGRSGGSAPYKNKALKVRCMIQVAVPYRQMTPLEASKIRKGYKDYLEALNN